MVGKWRSDTHGCGMRPTACPPGSQSSPCRGGLAVFDAVTDQLIRASAGAWRWLGWNVVEDGRLTRLPAELFEPLPHPCTPPLDLRSRSEIRPGCGVQFLTASTRSRNSRTAGTVLCGFIWR